MGHGRHRGQHAPAPRHSKGLPLELPLIHHQVHPARPCLLDRPLLRGQRRRARGAHGGEPGPRRRGWDADVDDGRNQGGHDPCLRPDPQRPRPRPRRTRRRLAAAVRRVRPDALLRLERGPWRRPHAQGGPRRGAQRAGARGLRPGDGGRGRGHLGERWRADAELELHQVCPRPEVHHRPHLSARRRLPGHGPHRQRHRAGPERRAARPALHGPAWTERVGHGGGQAGRLRHGLRGQPHGHGDGDGHGNGQSLRPRQPRDAGLRVARRPERRAGGEPEPLRLRRPV
mmetsp:Transcript_6108/g.14303  ORF Transcript_6108/g.14303 Transcript_6108/m.14303 type:complete len:286 (+) Transcript_6108:2357-3214(+)